MGKRKLFTEPSIFVEAESYPIHGTPRALTPDSRAKFSQIL